jgi:hypothetical protein
VKSAADQTFARGLGKRDHFRAGLGSSRTYYDLVIAGEPTATARVFLSPGLREILEAEMKLSWAAAAAVLLLTGVTQAEELTNKAPEMPPEDVAVGIGIICNTSEQVQRFVGLRAGGAEARSAVNVVNDEAKDPRACGVAAVAFMSDGQVETKTVHGKLVSIVRINIVAAFDGRRWSLVPAMTQYALMEADGYAI